MDKDSNENPVADGTTARDNQVSLLGSGSGQLSITNVEYNGTLEVTNGQPVQGTPIPSEFSGGWLIDLSAGGRVTRASPRTSKQLRRVAEQHVRAVHPFL